MLPLLGVAVALLSGCNGSSGTSAGSVGGGGSVQPPAAPVSVALTPREATLPTGGTLPFAATVTGTTNTAVTWSATLGTITPAGVYTAPSTAGVATVKATSLGDPTQSASATVRITAPEITVTITPAAASLAAGASQWFTATVTGTSNTAVTWTCSAGTINQQGLYAAPAQSGTVRVTATSVADPTRTATATVQVTAPTVGITVTPATVRLGVGESQGFTAQVTGTLNTAVTWSCSAGAITPQGLFTTPSQPGEVVVTATSAADPTRSATATVTVVPAVGLSISPASAQLEPGESRAFAATVTGSANTAVLWSCTRGSITPEGIYTAPSTPGTATLTATSVADPKKSASATVLIKTAPVSIAVSVSPASATLNVSGSRTFTATVTGTSNTAVTWTCSAGTITSGGVYTAPATAGNATVTATSVADPTRSGRAQVTVSSPCTAGIPAGVSPSVLQAVQTGQALTGATTDDFMSATLATLEHQRTALNPLIVQLYNLSANGTAKADGSSLTGLDWNPTQDSCTLGATFGVNTEVLVTVDGSGQASSASKCLGVAGVIPASQSRYLVLGSNPMWARGNDQMDRFTANAIQWLTGKPAGSDFKVAIVQTIDDSSYWFPYETKIRQWLTATYGTKVTFNAANALDGDNLGKVLTDGYDLVITSGTMGSGQDLDTVYNSLKALVDAGKPLLYVQADGDLEALGSRLFSLFQVTYLGDNYWSRPTISGLNGTSLMGRLPSNMASIRETLTRLLSGAYDFNLATWQTSDPEKAAWTAQFGAGASAVKSMMNGFDRAGLDIFASCGREVPKLLALLGDRLRQDIVYPYSANRTPAKDFLRAYFADHAVYSCRSIAPAQKDLGTFSREDFSGVTPGTRTVNLVSRPSFQPTGAYALPGRTVRVTRLDSNAVATDLFVNSLRSGSTHEWDNNGYARPKFLWTQSMPLKPGQTLTFTSCYGGPIQVAFNVKDVPVQLRFENVGEHPYWAGSADDASFALKLGEAKFDWVEVATPGFVMHSKLDRFKSGTMKAPWGTPQLLSAAVQRYTYNYAHIIAGFQGEGIDKEPEVYGWAQSKGITLPTTSIVKHMNADVPTCGWGCSGNPYDAGWAFWPTGHGDIHEMGHSLQSGRWQLVQGGKTYENHAGTNFYPYYVQARYFDETGVNPGGQGMDFGTLFKQLQTAYQAGDRKGAFSTAMETYCSDRMDIYTSYAFYIQLMMQARDKGMLANGWHMMGRIHALERAFGAADNDQATWDREKVKWGFDRISHAEARALNNTDFMAIAMSYTTGLDLRDYLAMWGFRINAAADAQIASYGFPAAERIFYAIQGNKWIEGALSTRVDRFAKLPIDGLTAWPLDSTLRASKATYTATEAIALTFNDTNDGPKDWIGIYPATQEPSPTTTALQRQYLNGLKTGTLTFTALPAGTYKAYLCINDEDVAISAVSFTVK